MLTIWNKSGEYDPQLGSLSSWAVALTRNKALDRLRARARRLRLIEEVAVMAEDSGATSSPSANEVIHGRERAEMLRAAMKDLPTEQRMAIELAFFTGMSQTDIATRLQQPLGTVKARIRRGMLRLREQLGGVL
jgi:RNA polymerase sigma-70 factor, ECF subfamily